MITQFLESYILLYLEFLALCFLMSGFIGKPLHKNRRCLLLSLGLVLINGLSETLLAIPAIVLIIGHILTILYFYYATRASFLHVVCIYALEYILVVLCSILLFAVFGLNGDIIFSGIVPYVGSFLILLFAYLAYRFLPLAQLSALILHHNTTLLLILANTLLLSMGFILYARFDSKDFFSHYIVILVFTLALLFINGEVFLNHQRRIQEKRQLDTYRAYLPIVENLITQVRTKQHDYHNCLQNIRGLCYTCTDYDALRKQLLDTTDYYTATHTVSQLLSLNLHLLAGFLISKSEEALHQSKKLELRILQPTLSSGCNEYELVEYMGILIDNALEATCSGNIIYADIDTVGEKLYFQIKNPGPVATPDFCKQIFSSGYTSKKKHSGEHGIGLSKLVNFTKKHHGELTVSNETIDDTVYLVFTLIL